MSEESFNRLAKAIRNNAIVVEGINDVYLNRVGLDDLRRRLQEALRADDPNCELVTNWIPEFCAYFLFDASRFRMTEAREVAEKMLRESHAG